MSKKKIVIILLIIFVSIALVATIGMYLLDTSGKINQGNYRINDIVLESNLVVAEKDEQEVKDLSSLVFDISQTNKITMLIDSKSEAKMIYIDNMYISTPTKLGKLYLTQNNYEEKFDLENVGSKINIYPSNVDGQYKIELCINNENCMQDVKVSSGTQSIRYDGTLLSFLNTRISDLKFNISFNLNIIDASNKKNVCKVKLEMPNEELISNGISVLRLDIGKFVFTVE